MDVRAWIEQQVEIAVSGEDDILRQRMHIVNVLAPTITKLAEALRKVAIGLHELDGTIDHAAEFENCDEWHCEIAKAALAELEKP